jgi:hypothetical protein
MHSYLKFVDGTYSVGMWRPDRKGVTNFWPMFDVPDRDAAITAVNMLNGGDTAQAFKVVRENFQGRLQ